MCMLIVMRYQCCYSAVGALHFEMFAVHEILQLIFVLVLQGKHWRDCALYDASQLGDYSVLYFKLLCWKDFRLYHAR